MTADELTNFNSLSPDTYDSCAICHECDLPVEVGDLAAGHKAVCPRCGFVLSRAHTNAIDRMLIFSITALVCLVFSNLLGFVQMGVQGQERKITLFETVQVLFELDEFALAAFMLIVIIGLPALFIGVISWLAISIKLERVSRQTINLLHFVGFLRFWNMAEIFFLGILISMVKVASLAHISVGFSFWAYGLFNLFLIAAMMHVDKFQLARIIRSSVRKKQAKVTGG